MEKPGAHHYVLNASSFRDVVEVPFYNTTLHIPVGFEEILVGFYGRNWRVMESRQKWEAKPSTQMRKLYRGDIPPKPICGTAEASLPSARAAYFGVF